MLQHNYQKEQILHFLHVIKKIGKNWLRWVYSYGGSYTPEDNLLLLDPDGGNENVATCCHLNTYLSFTIY